MASYNHKESEIKWQKKWEEEKLYRTQETGDKKFYILDMFPYPSGEGLHVGHPKGYIATDVYSRMKRMKGYDVLHPMGFDAFGLPAEQYALKNKVNPNISTAKNVARYKDQLKMLGLNYDWEREINTTDPAFYKWTQWMWKQMYKKGLAYEGYDPINWCPSCKTGLANEDLENGLCERCGSVVEKKPLRQWTIRITDYADRLLDDLAKLDWEPHIKELQKNWIGKSEGSELTFNLVNFPQQEKLIVFTTRADTLFGATFMAISYELAEKWIASGWDASADIKKMIDVIKQDAKQQDFSFKEVAEKKGIDTGIKATNPATGNEIPVYIANYVLSGYGTGALMAVPAHDERDYEFAKKYVIDVVDVCAQKFVSKIGSGIPNPSFETVYRHNVLVIVKNKDTGKYLALDWHVTDWKSFIGGGVEDDENYSLSAVREVKEEAGFKHVDFIHKVTTYISHFCNPDKKVNYHTKTECVYVEVAGESAISEEEKKKHTIVEIDEHDVEAFLVSSGSDSDYQLYCWRKFLAQEVFESREGFLVNSGDFDGLTSAEAKIKITEKFGGKLVSQYKLKEWTFARQRYWGEPFPIVFDENHVSYAVADSELPIVLPMVDEYEPTGTGESPLANIQEWVDVYGFLNADGEFETLMQDDLRAKKFRRETNTMPQWAGSSWYYLRYIDPNNQDRFVDTAKEEKWSPVDFYVGGAEHATRHLIYARFWHKFLFDLGLVTHDEPFSKLQTVGLIMAEDGRKMSKRWGNVVNPDDIVEEHGADTLRVYEMFMGPFDQSVAWSTKSMMGVKRFLDRVAKLHDHCDGSNDSSSVETVLHQTIKKVGEDIEAFKFNTAIAALMTLMNLIEKEGRISKVAYKQLLILLAPFAPYMTEELWREYLGEKTSIHTEYWPVFDPLKVITESVTVAIQISGKMRGTIDVSRDIDDNTLINQVKNHDMYKKYVAEAKPKKVIIIKNKIVNIVI